MSKRKLSLEVVKRLQCQKSVKIEGKTNNVKNSTKTGKNDLQNAQIYANGRKFTQIDAKTKNLSFFHVSKTCHSSGKKKSVTTSGKTLAMSKHCHIRCQKNT